MKFLLRLFFVFLIIFSTSFQAAQAQFSDIDEDFLTYLYSHKILQGYADKTFKPHNQINRAEFLKLVLEASNIKIQNLKEKCFSDIDENAWYAPYVCTAKNSNMIQGYPDKTFKPSQKINKAEALKIIAQVQKWPYQNNAYQTNFQDLQREDWYYPYAVFAENQNIIEPEPNFSAGTEVTRIQVAKILFHSLVNTKLPIQAPMGQKKEFFFELENKIKNVSYDNITAYKAEAERISASIINNPYGDFEANTIQIGPDESVLALYEFPKENITNPGLLSSQSQIIVLAKFSPNKELLKFRWEVIEKPADRPPYFFQLAETTTEPMLIKIWFIDGQGNLRRGGEKKYFLDPYYNEFQNPHKFLLMYPFSNPNVTIAEGFSVYDGHLGDPAGTPHKGIDYVLKENEEFKPFDVYSMHEGNAYQGVSSTWGKYVLIEKEVDGRMFETVYSHLEDIGLSIPSSRPGSFISAGYKLGKASTTGMTNNIPQLHLELRERKNGSIVKLDPYGLYDHFDSKLYPNPGQSLEGLLHYWTTHVPPLANPEISIFLKESR